MGVACMKQRAKRVQPQRAAHVAQNKIIQKKDKAIQKKYPEQDTSKPHAFGESIQDSIRVPMDGIPSTRMHI